MAERPGPDGGAADDPAALDGAAGATGAGWLDWLTLVAAAAAVAAGLGALGVPGGLVAGATIGAACVSVTRPRAWSVHPRVRQLVLIGIGGLVGTRVTPDTLTALRGSILPAVAASLLLIAAGLAITALLRWRGRAPAGDVLATSPGALEVLTVLAIDRGQGPLEVALFHLVRVLLVVLSVPLLVRLMG